MEKDFFKIINYYIYNDYLEFKSNLSLNKDRAFFIIPYYYYIHNYNPNSINEIGDTNILNQIKNNKFDLFNYVKEINSDYLFLFDKEGKNIENPEFLSEDSLLAIDKILKSNPYDFYSIYALTTYYYNKGKLDLDYYYSKLLEIDKNNPFILLKLARYQASALYKKYKNKKYLILGKNNIIKATKQFKEKNNVPTFFYSWLGYIEHELENYMVAINLYDKTISLNLNLNISVPEPYAWKAFSLNKLGKYLESLELCNWILNNEKINFENDKRDFRLYKVISDNYYNLGDYKNFYYNLVITINKYLSMFSFHINNDILLDEKNTNINFDNVVENNKLESFFLYNKNYIYTNIDKIILILAYFYKEKILGKNILFNDSRGIEKICYNYLKIIYEGKIN